MAEQNNQTLSRAGIAKWVVLGAYPELMKHLTESENLGLIVLLEAVSFSQANKRQNAGWMIGDLLINELVESITSGKTEQSNPSESGAVHEGEQIAQQSEDKFPALRSKWQNIYSITSFRLALDKLKPPFSAGEPVFLNIEQVKGYLFLNEFAVAKETAEEKPARKGAGGDEDIESIPGEKGFITVKGYLIGPGANLRAANLQEANLQGANLQGANLYKANLQEANLQGANLYKADLFDANLEEANLQVAYLRGAYLRGANLQEANLYGAYLEKANLIKANLRGANLRGANLVRAYLEKANLQGANLQGANLQGANLREANLQGAYLAEADLRDARLEGASLQGAILQGANLSGAKLKGAIFHNATYSELTTFPAGFYPEEQGMRYSR